MLYACVSQKTNKLVEGKIVHYSTIFFDSVNNEFTTKDNNYHSTYLYKDSCSIEQVTGIHFFRDTDKIYREWQDTLFYRFVDLSKGCCYHYHNLSDTAKPFVKYSVNDTSSVSKIGWMYYKEIPQQYLVHHYYYIADTMMEQINYQRIVDTFSGSYEGKLYHFQHTGYMRCDKKEVILEIDKPLNRKLGCPVVRIDMRTLNTMYGISTRIEFLSDTLTTLERKIFAAWEKNARENK